MKEKLKLEAQVTKVESEKMPELKALASVQFGGFRINNIRVIERETIKNGNMVTQNVVFFPQHKGTNKDGENEYKDIVTFGKDEEQGKKLRNVISNMIIKGLEGEEKTTKISKETDIEIDKDFVSAYINPTPNSEKILGAGTVYYGGLISIKPVYLKEVTNSETNEKFNVINFETRINKDNEYSEVVYPNQEGLRKKCVEESMKSLKKNKEQLNEDSKDEKEEKSTKKNSNKKKKQKEEQEDAEL